MLTPKLWKHLRRHPLSAEYEDILGGRWDALVADIRDNGFDKNRPIILYEEMVLDGWQRLRACVACGVEPTFLRHEGGDPEGFVKRTNDNRRHETEAQAERRIEARRKRVVEAKAAGDSNRSIAGKEGVSQSTVRSDLDAAGAQGCAPEPPGGKVAGKDGKQYPATKPKLDEETTAATSAVNDPDRTGNEQDQPQEEHKPTAGKELRFDDRKLLDTFGVLTREVDKRGNVIGKGTHHGKCQDILGIFLAAYKEWKKETE